MPESDSHIASKLRNRRLLQSASSAVLSKGVVLAVNAITIPIVVRYLGAEAFGLWTTISSGLSMLLVLDLGVANSLTNFISRAYAANDEEEAGRYSTTALTVMSGIALLLGLVAMALWGHIDWPAIFHISAKMDPKQVSRAVAVAFVIFLVGLPASLAAKILGGYQELRTANLFIAAGSLCNLLSVVILVWLHAGLVALITASSAALVLANLMCLLWILFHHKRWLQPRRHHISRAVAREMFQTGSEFFILQIAGLIVFNSDNLIVTHYLGPAEVAPYSVAWRLVGYAAIAQTLITPSLWPAFSEAFARGDLEWVRRTFRRTMLLTMSLALAFCVVFATAGQWIIRIWASQAAVPTKRLILLMCAWTLISTFMNNTATVLVAKGETRLQAICSIVAAALNVALSIFLVQRIGSSGVILATVLSYLAVLIIPQTWQAMKILRRES